MGGQGRPYGWEDISGPNMVVAICAGCLQARARWTVEAASFCDIGPGFARAVGRVGRAVYGAPGLRRSLVITGRQG